MMRRKMPVMVGRMAKDHIQDNFRQGGFVNGGLPTFILFDGQSCRLVDGEEGLTLSSRLFGDK